MYYDLTVFIGCFQFLQMGARYNRSGKNKSNTELETAKRRLITQAFIVNVKE
jgi:hypothetical protein